MHDVKTQVFQQTLFPNVSRPRRDHCIDHRCMGQPGRSCGLPLGRYMVTRYAQGIGPWLFGRGNRHLTLKVVNDVPYLVVHCRCSPQPRWTRLENYDPTTSPVLV